MSNRYRRIFAVEAGLGEELVVAMVGKDRKVLKDVVVALLSRRS